MNDILSRAIQHVNFADGSVGCSWHSTSPTFKESGAGPSTELDFQLAPYTSCVKMQLKGAERRKSFPCGEEKPNIALKIHIDSL